MKKGFCTWHCLNKENTNLNDSYFNVIGGEDLANPNN